MTILTADQINAVLLSARATLLNMGANKYQRGLAIETIQHYSGLLADKKAEEKTDGVH